MKCWAVQWRPFYDFYTVFYSNHEEECWRYIEQYGTRGDQHRVVRLECTMLYAKDHRNDHPNEDALDRMNTAK